MDNKIPYSRILARERNEILKYTTTWMNLKNMLWDKADTKGQIIVWLPYMKYVVFSLSCVQLLQPHGL